MTVTYLEWLSRAIEHGATSGTALGLETGAMTAPQAAEIGQLRDEKAENLRRAIELGTRSETTGGLVQAAKAGLAWGSAIQSDGPLYEDYQEKWQIAIGAGLQSADSEGLEAATLAAVDIALAEENRFRRNDRDLEKMERYCKSAVYAGRLINLPDGLRHAALAAQLLEELRSNRNSG
jgi:hypothetical protein